MAHSKKSIAVMALLSSVKPAHVSLTDQKSVNFAQAAPTLQTLNATSQAVPQKLGPANGLTPSGTNLKKKLVDDYGDEIESSDEDETKPVLTGTTDQNPFAEYGIKSTSVEGIPASSCKKCNDSSSDSDGCSGQKKKKKKKCKNCDDSECCNVCHEIYEVGEKAACTLSKVSDIDHDLSHVTKAVVAIGTIEEANHSLLEQILEKVCGNPLAGMTINCGCNCDGTTEPPGPGGPPEVDNCTSTTNTLLPNTKYEFSQWGIAAKNKLKEFWMASSAVNMTFTSYNDKFHGKGTTFPKTIDSFTQGAYAIRRLDGDSTAENQSEFLCDAT